MSDVVLSARSLVKTYRTGTAEVRVFANLELELRRGESTALIGESGAGKSTLLHLLGALDQPTSGEIRFGSRSYASLSDLELADLRNAQIGYVWQSYYLLPEFTAEENVMMPLLISGASQEEAQRAARYWLSQVGLAARSRHQSGELSGGEQQRVALARALVRKPSVLLADEPTGNLDQDTGEAVVDLLLSLPGVNDLALLIATHNLPLAHRCDRVLRLADGVLSPAT